MRHGNVTVRNGHFQSAPKPESCEPLKCLACRNAETVTNISGNDSASVHAGLVHVRLLWALSIFRSCDVDDSIVGGVTQVNQHARAEALTNVAESHVFDTLRGADAQTYTDGRDMDDSARNLRCHPRRRR